MSKELKNITNNVMDEIHQGKIKMKPKIYFILGSILTFIGLISSVIISIFLFSLIRFSLRTHGPMGQYRFDQILSYFPWYIVILAIFTLILGIWLIRKYDFSYKIKPLGFFIGFILIIVATGYFLDMTGLNDTIFHYGKMEGTTNNSLQINNIRNGPWWMK
jgi:hypothetical protein